MLCVTSFSFSIINSTEFDHEHELLENNVENIIQENNHSLSHTLKLNKIPNTRLRSTSAIEKFSKRNLPLNEFVSVVANATNALLGVSIFAMPWGFAKSGLMGNLIYFLLWKRHLLLSLVLAILFSGFQCRFMSLSPPFPPSLSLSPHSLSLSLLPLSCWLSISIYIFLCISAYCQVASWLLSLLHQFPSKQLESFLKLNESYTSEQVRLTFVTRDIFIEANPY